MADYKFYPDNLDDGEENDEADGFRGPVGRDGVIIAVECCKEMFQSFSDDESPADDDSSNAFERIVEGVIDMLRNKIICNEKDVQGLVFFGTREAKNYEEFKRIFVVQDLDSPSASKIAELQKFQEIERSAFEKEFGHSSEYLVSELLWCCSSMFSRSSQFLSSKTLVLFAWNDQPHQGDNNARMRARTKAKDLMEQDIDVQVLSFNGEFKYEKFYKDIMSDSEAVEPFAQNPIDGIKNLYDFLLRKCTKQRPIGRVPFRLFEGMEMSVGIYTVALSARKGSNVNIDKKTNQEVEMRTNFVETATGELMLPGDIKQSQKWVEKDIVFETEEVQDMRRFPGTGLTLLGFKPKDKAIKPWHHVKQAQFIYPNEKGVKGSTTLFSALLKKCDDRKVVPICRLAARSNSAPRCVALLAQQEVVDENTGEQTQSPGFYVITLPFSEDLRNVEIDEHPPPEDDQVKAAEMIIKKLRFPYHPSNFDNPALQMHYRNLEAMALDKDKPDDITDHTLPNRNKIDQKAGQLISSFKDLVFPDGYDPTAKTTKRKAGAVGGAPKKLKTSTTVLDMEDLARNGKLGKLTVPVLKEYCNNNGIEFSGKKGDIINAIERHFK